MATRAGGPRLSDITGRMAWIAPVCLMLTFSETTHRMQTHQPDSAPTERSTNPYPLKEAGLICQNPSPRAVGAVILSHFSPRSCRDDRETSGREEPSVIDSGPYRSYKQSTMCVSAFNYVAAQKVSKAIQGSKKEKKGTLEAASALHHSWINKKNNNEIILKTPLS